MIESISGSLISLSDSVIASDVAQPIFSWITSLFEFILKFWRVFVLIGFFWLFYGLIKGFGKEKKDKKNKDLENK